MAVEIIGPSREMNSVVQQIGSIKLPFKYLPLNPKAHVIPALIRGVTLSSEQQWMQRFMAAEK